jgi:HD superfamily phosphohydrolase YqeK
MSAADSTDLASGLSPVILDAAAGRLPIWAVVGESRRAHIERVVALLDEWAAEAGLSDADRIRWRAAGWLHDALRDEDPDELRRIVPPAFRGLPGPLLHGPAVAERLAADADVSVLQAVRYHTIGHPSLDRLGRALYLADFLEPGRGFLDEWRASLRWRVPAEMDAVLVDVIAARVRHLLEGRKPLALETVSFWNSLVIEEGS